MTGKASLTSETNSWPTIEGQVGPTHVFGHFSTLIVRIPTFWPEFIGIVSIEVLSAVHPVDAI